MHKKFLLCQNPVVEITDKIGILVNIQNYFCIHITVDRGKAGTRKGSPIFDAAKRLSVFTINEEEDKDFKPVKLVLNLKMITLSIPVRTI